MVRVRKEREEIMEFYFNFKNFLKVSNHHHSDFTITSSVSTHNSNSRITTVISFNETVLWLRLYQRNVVITQICSVVDKLPLTSFLLIFNVQTSCH